jgi:cardiolipin synthase
VGEQVYLDIINTAHTYVHIMTPYLILDYQMMSALSYAAKRGVEVVIIMPHVPDKKYAFVLAKTYYNELLEAGVRICEYEPGFVHAKVFVSDDTKAVVGTVNLDFRSLYHHFECGLVMYRNSQVGEIERDVQGTLENCIEISVDDYKNLKLTDKIVGKIMRIVAPLM